MTEGPLPGAWSPQKFVRHGGGSGVNGHTKADPAVLYVLSRHYSWDAALTEIVDLGLSDAEIWSGGWLAEWQNIAARRELNSMLAAARHRGGPPTGHGLTVDLLVTTVIELTTAAGQPTQPAVAEHLHVTDRWVREVARPAGGWDAICARAEGESQTTSG